MTRFLKIILNLALILFSLPTYAADKWQSSRIIKILPEGQILLTNSGPNFLSGINYQALQTKDKCFRRIILKELRDTWIDIPVKWRKDSNKILIKNTKLGNMSEHILKKGMGRLVDTDVSSYYKGKLRIAESQAKEKNIGVWNGCGQEKMERKIRALRQKLYFQSSFDGFLSPVSSAKVVKVISGNFIQLDNGSKVKLLGINIPKKNKESEIDIETCFEAESQKFLESLLVGRQIFLRADRIDFDGHGTLLRYIYLPSWRKNSDELLVNQYLIERGYAKSHWSGKNEYFKKEFESLQTEIYANPKGAWRQCVQRTLNEESKTDNEENPLVYDDACRIKGNISGTKSKPIKKYHTPKSPWYKRITKPEKCFETSEAAETEGFVKVK